MILITLKDYLELHPEEGVELVTEYGYYTLTREEIKNLLHKGGEVRSVTGRSMEFDTLLRQEILVLRSRTC